MENFKQEEHQEPIEELEDQQYEDAELHKKFISVKFYLMSDSSPDAESTKKQKAEFIAGEIACPDLTYNKNEGKNYQEKDEQMLSFKEELKEKLVSAKESGDEKVEALIQSYLWKVNEKIAKIRMMIESHQMNSNKDIERHAKRFKRYNEFIYGKPELEIFKGTIDRISRELEFISNIPDDQREAFDRLNNLVSNFNKNNSEIETPKFKSDDEAVKEDQEPVTDPEIIKEYFVEALQEIGLTELGWTAFIDDKGTRFAFAVDSRKKRVYIPMKDDLKNRQKGRETNISVIKGLIAHEIKTHALRYENGKRTKFKLLYSGFDRYLEGEEGLATYREHQETKPSDFAGFTNYFAAGLAYGLDNGEEKNFEEVAKILEDYHVVLGGKSLKEARELAWNNCYRIFKGSSGQIPGLIFAKDILYRRGNISTYSLMSKDGSAKINFDIGKYDPNNSRHITVLTKLGILDEDLVALDKD